MRREHSEVQLPRSASSVSSRNEQADNESLPRMNSASRKNDSKSHRKSWTNRLGSGNWKSLGASQHNNSSGLPVPTAHVPSTLSASPSMSPRHGTDTVKQRRPSRADFGLGDITASSAVAVPVRQPSFKNANRQKMDTNLFLSDDFRPDEYVYATLSTNSEDGVRTFQLMLGDAKNSATQDLKANVFRHYNEFVVISKEISQLESDMLYLSGLMNDLKGVQMTLMDDVTEDSDAAAQKSNPRDSFYIALDDTSKKPDESPSLYQRQRLLSNTHIQTGKLSLSSKVTAQVAAVYDMVEGIEKCMAFNPTRTVIRESCFVELDPKTLKYSQPVYIFLFNDCVLLASRKKRTMLSKHRYTATSCWALDDVAVMDMRVDKPDGLAAFRLHSNGQTHVFKCESTQEKRSWIGFIKKACEQSRYESMNNGPGMNNAGISVHHDSIDKTQNSTADGDSSFPPHDTETIIETAPRDTHDASNGDLGASADGAAPSTVTDTDYRRFLDILDELEVHTAHREFDEAVEKAQMFREAIDTLSSQNAAAKARLQGLRRQLDKRVQALAATLSHDLSNPHLSRNQIKLNLRRLSQLHLNDQARDIFLLSRSRIIKQRVRLLKFAGDIVQYVSELALVTFTLIRNTCDWYKDAFKEPHMASAFVVWAKSQLELYCKVFVKQVHGDDGDQTFPVIMECIRCTEDQCVLLKEVGIDMSFLISHMCTENMSKAIEHHEQKCAEVLVKSIIDDGYTAVRDTSSALRLSDSMSRALDEAAPLRPISKSTIKFHQTISEFLKDTSIFTQPILQKSVFMGIGSLFDAFLSWQLQVLNERDLDVDQCDIILNNALYLVEELFPGIVRQMVRRCEQPLPEADTFNDKFNTTRQLIAGGLCRKRGDSILRTIFKFAEADYDTPTPIVDDATPTNGMKQAIAAVLRTGIKLPNLVDKHGAVSLMLERFVSGMMEPDIWSPSDEPRKFSVGGVTQFVLDIHFLLKVCKDCINATTGEVAQEICERALKAFFTVYGTSGTGLKSGEWYEQRVNASLKNLDANFTDFGSHFPRKSPINSRRGSARSSSERLAEQVVSNSKSRISPSTSSRSVNRSHHLPESSPKPVRRSPSSRSGQSERGPLSQTGGGTSSTHSSSSSLTHAPLKDSPQSRGLTSKNARSVPNLLQRNNRNAPNGGTSIENLTSHKSEADIAGIISTSSFAPGRERRVMSDARIATEVSPQQTTKSHSALDSSPSLSQNPAPPTSTSNASLIPGGNVGSRILAMQTKLGASSSPRASLSYQKPSKRGQESTSNLAPISSGNEESTDKQVMGGMSSQDRLAEKLNRLERTSRDAISRERSWTSSKDELKESSNKPL